VIEAGAASVMSAYNKVNGVYCGEHPQLLTEILREQWGFRGFVVSDANAVRSLVTHGFAADLADAAARAVNVGVDLEMAIADPAYACLPEALDAGAVTEAALDTCVRRILEVKLRLGLLDDPFVDEDAARTVLADPAHRAVAREAAQRSVVLLRNEGGLLPLDAPSLTSIAVLGPAGRLAARHARSVVLRPRPDRNRDGA
jgi:beta-glucosidase